MARLTERPREYSVPEVADTLGIPAPLIHKLIKTGRIHPRIIPSRIAFSDADVEELKAEVAELGRAGEAAAQARKEVFGDFA
jgi:hypothetical protein